MSYIPRLAPLATEVRKKSVLLLGPRRTGKSSLIHNQIQADRYFDLLKSDVFQDLAFRPASLRESLAPSDRLVVIDEIQKLPSLMDEVHSLIEERGTRFILTGSSARKLKRTHTSLMAGRARRIYLHPFCFAEVPGQFTLEKALLVGTLPPVFLHPDESSAWSELRDYTGDYIREEVLAEAIVRKIEAFSRFLPVAAQTNGELLNFESIASDAQVPARTIREYYAVLEDTLVGSQLEPLRFRGAKSRKSIATAKFYFFDCGVLNSLLKRRSLSLDAPEFGNLFETWVHQELLAFMHYKRSGADMELRFWRSPQGEEVDFVVNGEVAIEVKATRNVAEKHLKGLRALGGLQKIRRKLVVSRNLHPKTLGDVQVLPWRMFAEALWAGNLGI